MDYKKLHKDTINRLQQMVNSGKITVEVARGIYADFIPESEDERIRKEIKDFFSRIMLGQENFLREDYDWNAWIAWIEKQYKKDEEIILLKDKIESLESARIAMQECHRLELEKLEKQGEQKPDDKVEPKFHEGEWVVTDKNNVVQIKAIEDSKYVLENTMRFSVDYVDKCWRKWTIQDAKDGDVLTCYSDIKGQPIEQTGIIKQYVGRHGGCSNSFKAHFGVDWDNNVVIEGYMGSSNIYPSTKEQRDLLFTKMKEAGYEWDADTKELKKIEKTSAWSEEDETVLNNLIYALANDSIGNSRDEYVNWLKSLKDRVLPQTHYAWSEEEIEKAAQEWDSKANFNPFYITPTGVKRDITTHKESFKAGIGWILKSLRPQNVWRPSDDQMKALHAKLSYVNGDRELVPDVILESLYNDLKELV